VPDLNSTEAARAVQYDFAYSAVIRDHFLEELHRRAIGDEYPDGIEVTGSCTLSMLKRALEGLHLPENGLLVDLGCGLGGPGHWIALRSKARLLGFDVSQVAVDVAIETALSYLAAGRADYQCRSFVDTGLPDACADGVIAVEALAFASDRFAAVAEVRRILRPGGRAVITVAERESNPFRWAPLVEEVGLRVVSRYDDPKRGERWLAFCALQLEHEQELRKSLGDEPAEEFLSEARDAPAVWSDPGLVGVLLVLERAAGI
jgi:SAM-dependent methyltransferase